MPMQPLSAGDRLEANLDAILQSRAGRRLPARALLLIAAGLATGLVAWRWHQPRIGLETKPALVATRAARPALPTPDRTEPASATILPVEPTPLPSSEQATALSFHTLRERAPVTPVPRQPHVPAPAAPAPVRGPQADDAPAVLASRDLAHPPRAPIEVDALETAEAPAAPLGPVTAAPEQTATHHDASRQESLDLIRALRRQ